MHDRAILRPSGPLAGPGWLALALTLFAGALGCGGPDGAWSPPPDGRAPNTRLVRLPQASLPFGGGARAPRAGLASGALAVAHPDADAMRLFARNCATCHGLDGSGQGPSVLDRPARNFKDGGFSFGNTADAIFNTISHGIPGTPMPAFGQALEEADRRRLAAYVRTLGPPVEDVDVADTILHVTDESGPLIVRGILPPIVKGAPIRPRGMLVGLPGGLTFEYRIDDVRLLGVRQGGFVERTDWRDRGGTPLKPLGGLIWTDAAGDPPATFMVETQAEDGTVRVEPLTAKLEGTAPDSISYGLYRSDGTAVGLVIEGSEPTRQGSLAGFSRYWAVHLESIEIVSAGFLRVRIPLPPDSALVESFIQTDGVVKSARVEWRVFRRPDGVCECLGTTYAITGELGGRPAVEASTDELGFVIPLPPSVAQAGWGSIIRSQHLFTTSWSSSERAELQGSTP